MPTIPVGPSYRAATTPGLASQSSSSLAAFTGAGRVCGTSARKAPRVTSNETSMSEHTWRIVPA